MHQTPSHPTQDTIHMVDLGGLHARLRPELDQAMDEVLATSGFIRGQQVDAFEKELCATLKLSGQAVGCGNGTDALALALRALDVGPGDEVIVPDFSFISTAEVVMEVGATPVFADIHPETFQLDPVSAEAARSSKTKAVMVVHLFGQCAPMDELLPWAEEHGLHLVEDNAQSLGAQWCGERRQGDAGMMGIVGTTSFFPSKNLGALGDGGAVLTKDEQLAERIRRLANHGAVKKYHHLELGVNSRLDGLQAAFLRVKLKHWSDLIARRRSAADCYDRLIEAQLDVLPMTMSLPMRDPKSSHTFHQYCLRLPKGTDRKRLQAQLLQAGIPTAVYYPTPLSAQPAFGSEAKVVAHGTPHAHDAAERILALPMHTELTDAMQTRVIDKLFGLLRST